MVTDELIRKEFIHHTISGGIRKIYAQQASIVANNLNLITGNLLRNLKQAPFTIEGGEKPTYNIRILPYLRYLDIHYRKGSDRISRYHRSQLALYNRTVWGVLYGETFPMLRYGLSEDVRKYIRKQLQDALPIDTEEIALLSDY